MGNMSICINIYTECLQLRIINNKTICLDVGDEDLEILSW